MGAQDVPIAVPIRCKNNSESNSNIFSLITIFNSLIRKSVGTVWSGRLLVRLSLQVRLFFGMLVYRAHTSMVRRMAFSERRPFEFISSYVRKKSGVSFLKDGRA